MAYNFKKNTKIYLVRDGLRYEMEVYPDISFSQTFAETAVPTKTLHNQLNFFDNAVISQASPANFNFTVPALSNTTLRILYTLLVSHEIREGTPSLLYCDIYFSSDELTYKLENAVLESGIFQISQNSILTMTVAGTASKLSEFVGTVPGTPQTAPNGTGYNILRAMEISVSSIVIDKIAAVTVELKNNNLWMGFDSVHNIATDHATTAYPRNCILQGRVLSGTIEQYIVASSINKWVNGTPLHIKAGSTTTPYLLEFLFPNVVYTSRVNPSSDLFMYSIDFRQLSTSITLDNIVKMNQS
jgi:hypothetical protein